MSASLVGSEMCIRDSPEPRLRSAGLPESLVGLRAEAAAAPSCSAVGANCISTRCCVDPERRATGQGV
eukprot:13196082-Alexandrium_andersonii.AAC.1